MTDEDYMRMAIEEARRAEELDEVPIGAVVVYEPIDPGTRRPLACLLYTSSVYKRQMVVRPV